MQLSHRLGALFALASLSTLSVLAQQPAATPAPAPGAAPAAGAPAAAARGAGGGGGRGAAGPTFTPAQLIALAALDIPASLTQAVTTANTELAAAAFKLPASRTDLETKASNLAKAELALATERATQFSRIGTSLNLTPEQMALVKQYNGLNRGGNTSPGATFAYDDYTGFTKIWDGKTFNGWDGEDDAWFIEDDTIHMDTARKGGQHHIHFTGLPGVSPIVKDFDFKVEFKTSAGGFNGGIQYRARMIQAAHRQDNEPPLVNGVRDMRAAMADPLGKSLPAGITNEAKAAAAGIPAGTPTRWQVSGYQFDITGNNMGSLYEGQYRGVIVNAGEIVQLYPNGIKFVIGRAADNPGQYTKPGQGLAGEWNQLEIIARGNTLIHILNGHVITVTTDDDPVRRAYQGIISLQCEGGAIWYRNVYLRNLDPIVGNTAPAR